MEKIKKAPSGQANTPNTANVPKANNQVFAAVSNFCSFLVGPGIIAAILVSFVVWQFGPNSRYHFDNMLEEIVTAKYNPHIPDGWAYITRDQDAELKEKLRKNIGSERDFFLLRGESGSGKTTMTQHLLKEDFEDGVIFVNINAESLEDVPKNKIRGVVQDAVLDKFPGCKNHPCLESFSFSGFIEHANDVRQTWLKSKGKKPRTLILYITLDTEDTVLKYKNMDDIAAAIGGMASHLSSISNKCKTILEFSETRISDTIRDLRGDLKSFKVKAMTEKEFLDIGKQLINVTDPEGLIEPYLKYYHDWLGGHTKALAQFAEEAQIDIESATADTKDEVLKGLKEAIDTQFNASAKQLGREQPKTTKLLTAIAATGAKGFFTNDVDEDNIINELMNRNSDSTLLRKADRNHVRIHRYSHALYLHGVEPNGTNMTETIDEVQQKFEMKATS